MKQKTKNIIAGILIIGIVIGILLGIRGNFRGLAILGQSSIAINEGADNKVYWVITGTAENIDSGYSFTRTFSTYAKQDGSGTTITPQDSLTLNIKTKEKSCTYQLYEKKSTLYRLTIIPYIWYYDFQYTYQLLLSPEKTFLIDFIPNKGNSIILDGSLQNSATIQDPDGQGKVTVQTQGALETKYDCPTNADVAVIRGGSNYKIVDKSDLEIALNNVGSNLISKIINLIVNGGSDIFNLIVDNFPENIAFTGAFESYPQVGSSYIKGIKDMGNPIFTITADQDYFDSVVYTPPSSSDPFIDQINSYDIKQGGTGGLNVVVKNRNSNQGSVTLTISAPYSYFYPSGETFVLPASGSIRRYFIETANNLIIDNPITAKVCTNNQFGSNKCDSKTVIQKIVSDGDFCGDGVCQATENAATCPDDCHSPNNCTEEGLTCASNDECCKGLSCSNGKCEQLNECEGCWTWLKDKLGIEQSCSKPGWWSIPVIGWFGKLFSSVKNSLTCSFHFLKLALILISSLFALLFGQQFANKTFRNIPYWATWVIAIFFSGAVGVLAYMFLEWYYVIPVLLVLFVFGIIVNAIPGGKYIMGAMRRR